MAPKVKRTADSPAIANVHDAVAPHKVTAFVRSCEEYLLPLRGKVVSVLNIPRPEDKPMLVRELAIAVLRELPERDAEDICVRILAELPSEHQAGYALLAKALARRKAA